MQRKKRSLKVSGTARRRMELVFAVLNGQMTVRAAARRLGVACKTYYAWENRVLAAVTAAVENRPAGRPGKVPDPEKAHLQTENRELRRRNAELETNLMVKDLLSEFGAVNRVLQEHYVLPLNSPRWYPPYNGSIEKLQRELKGAVREVLFRFAA